MKPHLTRILTRLEAAQLEYPDLLRDRWGFQLQEGHLTTLTVALGDALGERDPVEFLAMKAGLDELGGLASAADTPPEDWHLRELLRVARGQPPSVDYVLVSKLEMNEDQASRFKEALKEAGYGFYCSVGDEPDGEW